MAALLSVAMTTQALEPPKGDSVKRQQSGQMLSRGEAAKRAQAQVGGGRVLGIKLRNDSSASPYFDVKVLDGSKVRVLRIDAR